MDAVGSSATPRLLACGELGLLVEVGSLDEVLALAAALRLAALPGVVEIVPGAHTVLVTAESADALALVRCRVPDLIAPVKPPRLVDGAEVVIPVRYDGADLAEVAALTGLSIEAVIAAHTGTAWQAAFGGFAPGFVYLTGGDPRLRVPRRSSPRTSVPAGSVGLADEFSGIYPRSSPGGWQLIGRTAVTIFDPARSKPALIAPGDTVRFEAIR